MESQIIDSDNNHVAVEFTGGSGIGAVNVLSLYQQQDPVTIRVEGRCTPERPFYFRWINDLGGWEYQMAEEKRAITKSREVVAEFRRKNGTAQHIAIESEEVVTCGVLADSAEWAEALANLVYSPKIQLYVSDSAAWIDITLDDSQRTTVRSPRPVEEFEFAFVLPKRNVQF